MRFLLALLCWLIGIGKLLSYPIGDYRPPRAVINVINRENDTTKKPTFFLEKTSVRPMILLSIKDTAVTMADISQVLGRDYGEIFAFITRNGFKPGRIMAFYSAYQSGFILDAAVEVVTLPGQPTGRITIKKLAGGNAIVAHYRGPYEQVAIAYTAIYGWLKDQNKTADGSPFEVYLNDLHSVTEPSELRTDVYQLFK
ncbi:MAG TPA: GyrI-like domain-containing protein [Chitinophagaceae bacterium]